MTSLNIQPKPTFTLEPTSLKRWKVEDYHHMSELGILNANERTEPIAGQITLMAAKGTSHVIALRLLIPLRGSQESKVKSLLEQRFQAF